jgi:hypothetical protein
MAATRCAVTLPTISAAGFDAPSLAKVWTVTGCEQAGKTAT